MIEDSAVRIFGVVHVFYGFGNSHDFYTGYDCAWLLTHLCLDETIIDVAAYGVSFQLQE